ncbi:hypothetical protein IFM89_003758 [Coptis chinensis]|uniref:Fcf2 pre-rRNA processing C-terminal domain-containing protein n=1 Tax=Coptis chinensis TaxID=261450 RepID=A0A835IBC9_9MAGN|nr:hypothetical protein IFM89_003758 [Coptis chinensis]
MLEGASTIGLTWEPKIPILTSRTIASGSRKLESSPQNLVWKPDSKLIDGLFVPPNDPRKLNKLIRKQQKDTIQLLRSALDPKRHYKKSDSKSKTLPKYFQAKNRKIREIEEQKRPAGVEKWKNKGRQSWKRAKDRRH